MLAYRNCTPFAFKCSRSCDWVPSQSHSSQPYRLVSKLSVFFRSAMKIYFHCSHSIDSKHRRFAARPDKLLYAMFPIVSFVNSQQQFLPYRSESGNLCRRAQISARADTVKPVCALWGEKWDGTYFARGYQLF